MAQNLVINGVAYNGVESVALTNAEGEEVEYVEAATTTKHFAKSITLPVSGWVDNEQTVAVEGVLADPKKCSVLSGPDWGSAAECNACDVCCSAQGDGTLTFQCTYVPGEDVTVNVAVFV